MWSNTCAGRSKPKGRRSKRQIAAALPDIPVSCRKVLGGDGNPFLREFVVPYGRFGCVALFEIGNSDAVTLLAVRRRREEGCH